MRSSAAQLSATKGREDGERPVRQWWKDLLIYLETLGVRVVVFYNYKLRGKKNKKAPDCSEGQGHRGQSTRRD